tara:strand:+ start:475 stop:735 length:261 start_codon:yes stop_codon:yes gene_type:complete
VTEKPSLCQDRVCPHSGQEAPEDREVLVVLRAGAAVAEGVSEATMVSLAQQESKGYKGYKDLPDQRGLLALLDLKVPQDLMGLLLV